MRETLTAAQKQSLEILGFLYLRMGQFVRAKKLFAALLALDPGDVVVRLRLSMALIQLNDGEGALHVLTGVVFSGTAPDLEEAYYLLNAQAHALLGHTNEAREYALAFWRVRSMPGSNS